MSEAFGNIVVHVEGDGSEWVKYVQDNMEYIPDFMWNSVCHVLTMAENWIQEQAAGSLLDGVEHKELP